MSRSPKAAVDAWNRPKGRLRPLGVIASTLDALIALAPMRRGVARVASVMAWRRASDCKVVGCANEEVAVWLQVELTKGAILTCTVGPEGPLRRTQDLPPAKHTDHLLSPKHRPPAYWRPPAYPPLICTWSSEPTRYGRPQK